MNKLYAAVALDVAIYDLVALEEAARIRAMEDGLSHDEWEEMRTGPEDDLQMLLDPGALFNVGFEILGSSSTLTHSTFPR
jgi:hypothetical protein